MVDTLQLTRQQRCNTREVVAVLDNGAEIGYRVGWQYKLHPLAPPCVVALWDDGRTSTTVVDWASYVVLPQ